MSKYFKFLDGRIGADDSDVDALISEFSLDELSAGSVYRAWLDQLND